MNIDYTYDYGYADNGGDFLSFRMKKASKATPGRRPLLGWDFSTRPLISKKKEGVILLRNHN